MRSTPSTSDGGSPPHMRGKVSKSMPSCMAFGITPAHAGKSALKAGILSDIKDHPRTCGEKRFFQFPYAVKQGSPPHMRGKVQQVRVSFLQNGITPAHAGKSFSWCRSGCENGDHPRTCGEKWSSAILTIPATGSPPHMRGKDSGSNEI